MNITHRVSKERTSVLEEGIFSCHGVLSRTFHAGACACVCLCVGRGVAVHFCVLNFIIELILKALSWCAAAGKCFNMCDEFPNNFLKPNHN